MIGAVLDFPNYIRDNRTLRIVASTSTFLECAVWALYIGLN